MSSYKSFKSLELVVLGLLAALIVALAFPVVRDFSIKETPAAESVILNP
ncbi:MAG: hypothetical protein KDD56_05945 [Bdellovibrionales bacterium]|nr:hypothetical protein [Bdellovibrionales bacterium]